MSYKIVVLDGIYANPGDLSWNPLKSFGELMVYDQTSKDDVLTRSQDADILIINKILLREQEFLQLPNLKLVVIAATGTDNVDLEAAKRHGIDVKNVSGYSSQSVAQHTFSLILALTNKVAEHHSSIQSGEWNSTSGFSYTLGIIPELSQLTLAIVGFGQIGQQVARIGKAFGMKILIVSDHLKETSDYELVSLENAFSKADIVSLHWPLSEERKGIINKDLLNKMKPSALLINTARGGLINEPDLVEALQTKRIAGAALDVLANEPPETNHPLLELNNCIVTPHMAWASNQSRKVLLEKVFGHVKEFINS